MKKKFLSGFVLALCLLSLVGVGSIIVRDLVRSPDDWMTKAESQIKANDYRGALLSLTRAAKGANARAAYKLALLYDAGDKVPENRELAITYMRQAAQDNLPDALYVMAVWTERGYFGSVNTMDAVKLYESAAAGGHINAMKSLIVLYGTGLDGIPANPERQAYWIQRLNTKGK